MSHAAAAPHVQALSIGPWTFSPCTTRAPCACVRAFAWQVMSSGLLAASLALAKVFIVSMGATYALQLAAGVHVLAWVLQFYGHGKHEGATVVACFHDLGVG